MKTPIHIILFLSLAMLSFSQTYVRMRMPQQSERALEVITLFSEDLPVGIPVVLGVIGFDISGGDEQYTLEWLQNDSLLAVGDIAVITPKEGKTYSLKVSDNSGCYAQEFFTISSKAKVKSAYFDGLVDIYPTVISNELSVIVKGFLPLDTRIRIFSTEGKLCLDQQLVNSFVAGINWNSGVYYVVITADELHQVTKIIVKK
ncbi:MAG: hypothetical protein BGO29_07690 [Bacteroidales bacterium 36-12]|nr:MAG: hypothetical protein BGO29_07690 [Bacteroidales bacterium 36-12]